MILEDKQLLYSLLKEKLLQINPKKHERTWEYYYEQYHKAFRVFLEIAKQKKYQTNRKYMPFLFMMRHSLELFLKRKISETPTPWGKYGTTHELSNLSRIANINEEKFLDRFDCLKCDSQGDCFRYLLDTNNNKYFGQGEEIKAFDACDFYCSFLDNDDSLTKEGIDKKLQWELTFHTRECNTLGLIGTQYDSAILDILRAIKSEQISINDVYLPLLFLLRHCLEIKLKFSIMNLGNVVSEKGRSKIQKTHSVKKLYDIFSGHIKPAIESITEKHFKEESEDRYLATKKYKDIIASLDANSFSFRFPKDEKGYISNFVPTEDCVSEVLELYWKSDSFLCFSVPVLFEAGVLNIGDDREREYYE